MVEELQEAEDENFALHSREGVSGSTNSLISAYHRSM